MATKILVVDDDYDSLKLVGLMLERRGYEILVAPAGRQALEKAFSEEPALVVLDIMMPDMDGYEVCRQLRANPATQTTPIIMFSAKTKVDDKVTAFEVGADDYLTKPIHPDEFIARVEALLARGGQQTQTAAGKGTVVAFLAAKGGAGTSTLAVNVAAALTRHGESLFAEFRPGMGSTGLELGFSRSAGLANLASKRPEELDQSTVEAETVTHTSGLKLLLSSARPTEAELHIAPDVAEAIVEQLAGLARTVVLDLGTGLTRLNRRLVNAADQSIIVVEPQRTALLMTRRMLQEMAPRPDRVGVVLVNRVPSEAQIGWQEAELLLEKELLAVISPAPELALRAVDAGLPIILYQPSSVAASQFSRLAEDIVSRTRLAVKASSRL